MYVKLVILRFFLMVDLDVPTNLLLIEKPNIEHPTEFSNHSFEVL